MNNLRRQYLPERPKNFKEGLEILYKGNNRSITRTYYKDGTIACNAFKYRSLGAVYNILKGYFPTLKLQTLVDYIEDNTENFGFMGCPDILDVVITGNYENENSCVTTYTEYYFNQYKHKYEAVFS